MNEINASLHKLLSGNKKCDDSTNDSTNDGTDDAYDNAYEVDDANKQQDPYVSAMLRR